MLVSWTDATFERRVPLTQVRAVGYERIDVEPAITELEFRTPRKSEAIHAIVRGNSQAETKRERYWRLVIRSVSRVEPRVCPVLSVQDRRDAHDGDG